MRKFLKLIAIIWILFTSLFSIWSNFVQAEWVIWISADSWDTSSWSDSSKEKAISWIADASIKTKSETFWSWEVNEQSVKSMVTSILVIVKTIINALLVLFIVYAGAGMILYNGTDDSKLDSSKMQINYALVWLFFINIPGALASMVKSSWTWNIDLAQWWFKGDEVQLIFNSSSFESILSNNLIPFMEIAIWVFAWAMIVLAWVQTILDRGKWENLWEAKNKIIYWVIALIMVWFIEAFKKFVFTWNLDTWESIFQSIWNLLLFFVWPASITAFIYAWYLYITANWEDSQWEKAKNIVINTIIWVLIVLSSWSILTEINF